MDSNDIFPSPNSTLKISTCLSIEGDPVWVVSWQVPRFEIQIICESGTCSIFLEKFKTSDSMAGFHRIWNKDEWSLLSL